MTINNLRLASIFMPRAIKELNRFAGPDGPDFVHYTSAENFMNIFNAAAPSIWMRNAKCMNDVSEIEHGLSRISLALSKNNRLGRLKEALNGCHDRLGENSIGYFQHMYMGS